MHIPRRPCIHNDKGPSTGSYIASDRSSRDVGRKGGSSDIGPEIWTPVKYVPPGVIGIALSLLPEVTV